MLGEVVRLKVMVYRVLLWVLNCSRILGVPGVKGALLEEFGIRLVTYDLPGFGESAPDPKRDLDSSALDMLHLSYAVNVTEKFWVLGYSDGSKHAWAALHYIPDRIAGNCISVRYRPFSILNELRL